MVTRISLRLDTIAENVDQLVPLIVRAQVGNVHLALGYKSWPDLIAARFGDRLARLARLDRGPVVEMLSTTGMSTRAIAATIDVSKSTVDRQVSQLGTPGPEADTGPVAGLDGKTYTRSPRPEPAKPPRRNPLPDQYRAAVWELDRAVRRLEKLHADDRFTSQRGRR